MKDIKVVVGKMARYGHLTLYLGSLKKGAVNNRPWSSHLFSGDSLFQCPGFTVKRWIWFATTKVMLALAVGVLNRASMSVSMYVRLSVEISLFEDEV